MCMFHFDELNWDYVTCPFQTDWAIKCWQNNKTLQLCACACKVWWIILTWIFSQADWISGWLGKNSKQRGRKILNMLLLLAVGVQPIVRNSAKVLEDFHKGKVLYVLVYNQVCLYYILEISLIFLTSVNDHCLTSPAYHFSHLLSYLARRCEFLSLQGWRSLHDRWTVFSGHTTPCWWGGIRAGAPEGVSSGLWATALRAAGWDDIADLSSCQGSFLLTSAGPWQHAERTATHTPSGKREDKYTGSEVTHTNLVIGDLSVIALKRFDFRAISFYEFELSIPRVPKKNISIPSSIRGQLWSCQRNASFLTDL